MTITQSLVHSLLTNLRSWREITVTPAWKSELLLEPSTEVFIFPLTAWMYLFLFPSFSQLHFLSVSPVNFLEGTEIFHTLCNTQPSLLAVLAGDLRVKSRPPNPGFLGLRLCQRRQEDRHIHCRSTEGQWKGYLAEQRYGFLWSPHSSATIVSLRKSVWNGKPRSAANSPF